MLNRNQPKASSPEHCDDAQLMSFVSDDLPVAERSRVEGHLGLCWRCKERQLALRDTMLQIRKAAAEESVLDRGQIERARDQFWERFAGLESEMEAGLEPERVPALRSLSRSRDSNFPASLAIAAAIACLLGAGFAWLALRPPAVEFEDVLVQTLEREDYLRRPEGPLHQEFEIEIEQSQPALQLRSGVLQVWYDTGGERFASRWERADGDLGYAVWRPEPDREFVFNAQLGATAVARTPRPGQAITLGELTFEEASLEQLESGFLYWLSNRRWEPISIASEVNVFRMREGVVAEVESVTSLDGRPAYRITASRAMDWGRVELIAEIDAQTYESKIELLRLVSPDRVVALRLRAQHTRWLPSGTMESGLFWPSVDIEGGGETLAELRPAPPPPSLETRESEKELSAAPSPVDLDLAEMRVRYALHKAGACLGVPVRVDRSQPGVVHVEGLVESSERKHELLSQLAAVSATPFVSIDIKTVDEAVRDSMAGGTAEDGELALSRDARQADETFEVVATDSPIRNALERYLRQANGSVPSRDAKPGDAKLHELASEFSDGVISSSLANLTEAWALRRLAERYGDGTAELPDAAAAMLREMLRGHVAALKTRTAGIQRKVGPLLLTVASVNESGSAPGESPFTSPDSPGKQEWAAQSLRIFRQVEFAEGVTTGLFADAGNAGGGRRAGSSEQAAAALLRALPPLERGLQSLEERLAALDH
jgi:hypothetical protein